ncbi:hypothetical protein [Algivirga pacifica]|uniref:Carbohydrate-binding family V/XII n=1 Tax=Algivirga pacifica TaxID=1162670 RepID=A0ABP9D017_9BACT
MTLPPIKFHLFLLLLFTTYIVRGQHWPQEITLSNKAIITIYQPQPEKLQGNTLSSRAAVAYKENQQAEPNFGAMWIDAQLLTNKDTRMATMESITIKQAKFPGIKDEAKANELIQLLEKEIPQWELEIHLDEIVSTLEDKEKYETDQLNTAPPEVIYRETPSILVTLDGDPIIEKDEDLNLNRVVNTPFFIIQNPDDQYYYIYGGGYWYQGKSVKGKWKAVSKLSPTLQALDKEIKKQEAEQEEEVPPKADTPPEIIIVTQPTELIQSDGKAQFASVEGSGLLYMSNTNNDIFMDINTQEYFVILSGRWYRSKTLNGQWTYVPADQLPEAFANIPEGSEKDNVLANVAGTDAANEALLDAQIPQTAKVERSSTECNVTYDGSPKFERIEGTNMQVAVNTSSTVLQANGQYYCVENGVWFVSPQPTGPWEVSTERPSEVERIPADNPAYNVKYVYIYDVTPTYVYTGYTPGYLGTYVFGPTVVYGTGFYYHPWHRRYYYPRPCTWGFGMHYNPWYGWSMSFHYSRGWFNYSYYGGHAHHHRPGGWWGPPVYRPPYRPPYHGRYYGRYGRSYNRNVQVNVNRNYYINNNHSNNLYSYRKDVRTRDVRRGSTRTISRPATTPSRTRNRTVRPATSTRNRTTRPTTAPQNRSRNNVYTDKSGKVYRRDQKGNWQSRQSGQWKSSSSQTPKVERGAYQRSRSQTRVQNYNRTRTSTPSRTRTRSSQPVRRR